MTTFADSSVIVKLYVPEAGHEQVRELEQPLVISGLANVEVAGALWRKQRLGELETADAALLVRAFLADCAEPGDASPFVTVAVLPAHPAARHQARGPASAASLRRSAARQCAGLRAGPRRAPGLRRRRSGIERGGGR